MLNDESLNAAIHATIAKQIVEGLGSEAREALLLKSMTKALTDYRFTSAVEQVVAAEAMRVAADLVKSDDWHQRITEAIRAGFDDYLVSLRIATEKVAKEMMHGNENSSGSYNWPGKVLGHWPKEKGS